jgi:hypothetical protein
MLSQLTIASPCTASWESMTGDERSRHCSECNRNVYNFAAMTSAEIEELVAANSGGRLCGRLYRRADGTVLTSDCPVGLRARVRRVSRRLSAALAAAMTFACTGRALPQDTSMLGDVAVAQSGLNISLVDNARAIVAHAPISIIDLKSHKQVATGRTSDDGKFVVALAAGDYRVLIQKPGFRSQSVTVSIRPHQMQRLAASLQEAQFVMGIVAMPVKRPSN